MIQYYLIVFRIFYSKNFIVQLYININEYDVLLYIVFDIIYNRVYHWIILYNILIYI